jgi:hypothetical protein
LKLIFTQILLFLERFIYKKATLIIGQSNEIITHVTSLFPNKKCYLYRNFPDHKVENLDLITGKSTHKKIFYAGL